MFLTPVPEHELLLFWLQLVLLLAVARGLGSLAQRIGQPAVVGELAAGLLVGPSVLGALFPDAASWLFPGGEVESALLLAVSWVGIVLLLVVTGFETDLELLRRLGRASVIVSTGSLLVPLGFGYGLGLVLPDTFLGSEDMRVAFAMFAAVALSVSALPVVARILTEMRLMRRDVGQVTLAAGMANDLVGWLLLGVVAGVATGGGFELGSFVTTIVAAVLFLVGMLTIGQRLVDAALRRARVDPGGRVGALTVTVLTALAAGAVTHAIGMEAVLGAFAAGIVLGRSRYQREDVTRTLETLSTAVFAPIFFATAGLYVDLRALADPSVLAWTAILVTVAAVSKLVGSFVGARLSSMSAIEGLAIGIGLNARGALEIVVATIGLGLGVLNQTSYTAVVVMALVTSMAAPPLLRPVLRRLQASPDEAARLEREELLARSVLAHADHALLPTRGGLNSASAARLLDLALRPDADVTVLTIAAEADLEAETAVTGSVVPALGDRRLERRRRETGDTPAAILAEAELGYGVIALGMSEEPGTHRLSSTLREVLARTTVPVLLVRRGHDGEITTPRRVVVPVTGTRVGRAAEEVAYTVATAAGSAVDAVHVITRADRSRPGASPAADQGVARELSRARETARRFGRDASTHVRVSPEAYEELRRTADQRGADTIVVGAELRSDGDLPFLGHGVEYLLDRAPQTVVVVVLPQPARDG